MGASIFRILIFVFLPSIVIGQSLSLSVSPETSDNGPSTFLLENGDVAISSGSLQFLSTNHIISSYESFGISPDRGTLGVLKRSAGEGQVVLLSSAGDTLSSYSAKSLASDDPSLAVFPFDNGSTLLRDNITNFTFYNIFGEIATNMSSSSQSEEGEAISEVAMSPRGETIVIYNPKIKRDGNLGSKAQVMLSDNTFQNIFFSSNRYLKEVTVSEEGNFIVAITARRGTSDQVLIMDKYGNELNTISSDEDLTGASFSDNAEYITLFSGGRVVVYSAFGGNRLGATSVRSPIFTANYFPADDVILILTGTYSESSGILNNGEFRAIDIGQRKIASEEISGALGFTDKIIPRLVRVSSDEYQLVGSSRHVTIKANF